MNARMLCTLLLSLCLAGTAAADGVKVSAIDTWMTKHTEQGEIAAAVIAEVQAQRVDVRGFGRRGGTGGGAPDAETQFQIGSVTKVFTHLLLAELEAAGTVQANSTVADFMPAAFHPRNPKVAAITLGALSTHSSGLPRLPANLRMDDPTNPYGHYDEAALHAGLAGARDKQPLGGFYTYSNFGVGLLGHLLGRADGDDYRRSVIKRVIEPLRLSRTGFAAEDNAALASSGGKRVPNWTFHDAFAGAGALWSSAGDLARLIQAWLGHHEHTLKHDLLRDLDVVVADAGGYSVTRVWHVARAGTLPIFWHNGGVAGFHSFVGFRPDEDRGIVILVAGDADPTTIGLKWLGQDAPKKQTAQVDRSILGQYRVTEQFGLGVLESDGVLVTQASGQAPVAMHSLGKDWYALGDVDASLHFLRDEGAVTQLELVQNGVIQPAKRVDDTAIAAARKTITLDPAVLQNYVGVYAFAPGVALTVKQGDGGLEAQLTGQSFFPVYARAEDRFFYKVVDAELAFERDERGAVSVVVLHQGGVEQRAKRLP